VVRGWLRATSVIWLAILDRYDMAPCMVYLGVVDDASLRLVHGAPGPFSPRRIPSVMTLAFRIRLMFL
jgi:hypothetical protein